jgi:hypothetical protein
VEGRRKMDIQTLKGTLTSIENELLKRKVEKIASGERELNVDDSYGEIEDEHESEVDGEADTDPAIEVDDDE